MIDKRAKFAEDQRLIVLVRVRQVGIERVARALAGDANALQLIRESHAAKPSNVLDQLLEKLSESVGNAGVPRL